jgi:hypothetical protein
VIDGFRRERTIRRVLRQLARQRVVSVLQPGNVWLIERALENTEDHEAALRTCHMRGWVEPLADSIPGATLGPDANLPPDFAFDRSQPLYRLTDSGWAAIHRTHVLALLSALIALVGAALAALPFLNG